MYIEKVDVLHILLQNILLERSLKKSDFSKPSLCHGWCDKRHASSECFSAKNGVTQLTEITQWNRQLGEGGLGILSLVSSSLGFMKIEDDLIDVVLDQYMLPKV